MATKKTNIYDTEVFAFGKGNAGKMIPNTAFYAGSESDIHFSIKNKTPSISSKKITSRLSDKIARAVLNSQVVDDDTLIGWGKLNGSDFLLGQFSGGTANGKETFVIIPKEKKILTTNVWSSLFYRLVIAKDLLDFVLKGDKATDEDKETFIYLDKLNELPDRNIEGTSFILDSGAAENFVPLCDSIFFSAIKLNGFKYLEIEPDDALIEDYLDAIQFNVLPLTILHNRRASLSLPIILDDGTEENLPEILPPTIKKMPKNKKTSKTSNVPYSQRDYTIMSDDEAKSLPEELQQTRQIAIDLFERNKEFITDEQWEMINSFHKGNIWKMGFFGESATGKTTLVKKIAGALKLPFLITTGCADTETSHLYGAPTLKDGNMEFCDGPLTKIMRYGGIFFFDERNMVSAGVVASTNNVLDDTRMYVIPQTGETLSCHPNFRYCEAFNIGYEGTRDDNLSHISRIDEWHKLSGYEGEMEAEILVKETGIQKNIALKMIQAKNNITNEINGTGDGTGSGDPTVQRVDLRSCLSWAKKAMDLEGDVVRASLSTVMTPLAKEVDDVKSSNDAEKFLASDDALIIYAMNAIKTEFSSKAKKLPTINYDFKKYSLT